MTIEFGMQLAIGCLGVLILRLISNVEHSIKELTASVIELNKNMAIVVLQVASHEKRFDSNDKRFEKLEMHLTP